MASARATGPHNVATATNVSSSGHTTSVYSDDDVTIIERDGRRQVIRHGEDTGGGEETGGGNDSPSGQKEEST